MVKGALAAGLVAALLAFAPVPANADTNVRAGVGMGYWGGGHWGGRICHGRYRGGNCGSRHHYRRWPPYYYSYYYPYRSYYNHPNPVRYGLGCRDALSVVIRRGFHRVATRNCGGSYHVFTGWRKGHRCLITVRRSSGAIVSIRYI